jgi:hypothetical protein
MSTQRIIYSGREVVAEIHIVGSGFQWTYQIDDGPLREGRDRPLKHESIVLAEAISSAKREIDRMNDSGS